MGVVGCVIPSISNFTQGMSLQLTSLKLLVKRWLQMMPSTFTSEVWWLFYRTKSIVLLKSSKTEKWHHLDFPFFGGGGVAQGEAFPLHESFFSHPTKADDSNWAPLPKNEVLLHRIKTTHPLKNEGQKHSKEWLLEMIHLCMCFTYKTTLKKVDSYYTRPLVLIGAFKNLKEKQISWKIYFFSLNPMIQD